MRDTRVPYELVCPLCGKAFSCNVDLGSGGTEPLRLEALDAEQRKVVARALCACYVHRMPSEMARRILAVILLGKELSFLAAVH